MIRYASAAVIGFAMLVSAGSEQPPKKSGEQAKPPVKTCGAQPAQETAGQPAAKTVFCPKCRKTFAVGQYCPKCNRFMLPGTAKCPKCNREIPKGSYCPMCKAYVGVPGVTYSEKAGKPVPADK